jgi:hypothetical protein
MLNKEHPRFRNVWNELKSGMYNAFSMEFMPVHEAKEWIGKELTNVVDDIKYLSTSLVRAPANEGAFITKVYAKSFQGLPWTVSKSLSATADLDNQKNIGERKMQNKDLGRETGTTAPERSNTALGEWGDPTLEKGQAQLRTSKERMSALNQLKPKDTPFHPRPRRAPGAQGKAVPAHDPSQVDPHADEQAQHKPNIAESQQTPEDYKAVKREEEEEAGFSYEPSQDAPQTETDQTKFEEEEEEEERCMEEAYKSVLRKTQPNTEKLFNKAAKWLSRKYPDMPGSAMLKAAGAMTEVLGEVNAPQKISKEQKPPEVDYGKYGEPDMPAPLATFSARVESIVKKAVADETEDILSKVEESVKRYSTKSVVRKGYGAQETVREQKGSEYVDDTIEASLRNILGGP